MRPHPHRRARWQGNLGNAKTPKSQKAKIRDGLGGIPTAATVIAAVVIAAVVLAIHAARYLPFFEDDAFISLRYAQRLLSGKGLTWTDGPRVEGYSNLLWILLVSGLGRLGIDLVAAARGLGFLSTLGAAAAIIAWGAMLRIRWLSTLIAVLSFVLAVPVAAWSIGGLEQPLVAGLLAWSIVLIHPLLVSPQNQSRRWTAPSILLGLLCLTRPDSPILVASILLALVLVRGFGRDGLRTAVRLAAIPFLCIVGQQIFRLAYYGRWLPNPALVKITPSHRHLLDGLDYLTGGFAALMPVSLLAIAAALAGLRDRSTRPRMIALCTTGLLWAVYLLLIGGDVFRSWRAWIPLIVVMVMALCVGLRLIERKVSRRSGAALALMAGAALAIFVVVQNGDYRNQRLLACQSEWDGQVVGWMLKEGFGSAAPLLALDPAGSIPYWSELPCLDMLGLNDDYLPRHPPPDFGRGFLGHELGDGAYVLGRKPDLVLFKDPFGRKTGVYRSGREMQALPEFREQYTLVNFEGRRPYGVRSMIWVRRMSERIGIREEGQHLMVPSYLLNAHDETVAYVSAPRQFAVDVSRERPAGIRDLTLGAGHWRAEAVADGPVIVTARLAGATIILAQGTSSIEFDCASAPKQNFDIELSRDGTGVAVVSGLVLSPRSHRPQVSRRAGTRIAFIARLRMRPFQGRNILGERLSTGASAPAY